MVLVLHGAQQRQVNLVALEFGDVGLKVAVTDSMHRFTTRLPAVPPGAAAAAWPPAPPGRTAPPTARSCIPPCACEQAGGYDLGNASSPYVTSR